jgi:glycosyltransferase involved in cell wall biosynthesis
MLLGCSGARCLFAWLLQQPSDVTKLVVIDITRLLGRYFDQRHPTGVDRVSLEYLQHYAPAARAMLRWRGRSGLFSTAISKQVIDVLLRWDYAQRSQLKLLIARGVLSAVGTGNAHGAVFLHTGHNDAELPSLWRNLAWHHLRPVFFVHDLIPLTHPQFCRAGEAARHQVRIDRMLQGAAVVANSHYTLTQLQAYADSAGRIVPPACVARLAPPAQLAAVPALHAAESPNSEKTGLPINLLGKPYFVVLGTIEPRKNHALLLEVWRNLLQVKPNDAPHLVVIGQAGWDCAQLEAQLRDTAAFNGHVHWVQRCDDASLLHWLRAAQALLFPSFAEGFGMPMAEALSVGTPVIASDLAVYREFAGNVPLYLRPSDAPAWCAAVADYAKPGNAARAAQCQQMQGLRLPTWAEHFVQVDALFVSLDDAALCDTTQRLNSLPQHHTAQPPFRLKTQGFSARKKNILQHYLQGMGVAPDAASFVWGATTTKSSSPRLQLATVHVEDGFIRSVGLGADLVAPLSWVFDTRGIYFDATQPSDLEHLLQTKQYTPSDIARAAALRVQLVKLGLTKYNLSAPQWQRPSGSKKVILVAGQVETDASIRLGAHAVRSNLQLLKAVRQRCPDAYVVYKPHPDVMAGLRAGQTASHDALQWANEVLTHADTAHLLGVVDEVHVITSLMGFEALLRNVKVVVYGSPFYAGWGLCDAVDLPPAVASRRTRQLSIDQLVAATLIDYPVYWDPRAGMVTSPEHVMRLLAAQRGSAADKQANQSPTARQRLLAKWAQWQGRF